MCAAKLPSGAASLRSAKRISSDRGKRAPAARAKRAPGVVFSNSNSGAGDPATVATVALGSSHGIARP